MDLQVEVLSRWLDLGSRAPGEVDLKIYLCASQHKGAVQTTDGGEYLAGAEKMVSHTAYRSIST